jgi:RNA polymerase subunit RPABC4/transcription elongation factor Spt4
MANLKKCKKCGKLFSEASESEFCSACDQVPLTPLDQVKVYLEAHEMATIEDISRDVKIDLQALLLFYKEGKLTLQHALSAILTCESCDALIRSGRYCDACAKKTSHALRDAFSAVNKTEEAKEVKAEYRSSFRKK